MITELFLSGLFGVADIILGLLPEIEWTIDTGAWQYLSDFLSMICWLLPMAHIRNILVVIIALAITRIQIAVARFILGLIPFVG